MQNIVPLHGFGGVPYSAVRRAAPRNLLDNSDFRNPVNQRGQASYTAEGYTVDRWVMTMDIGTVNVVQGGLNLDAANHAITFAQYLDDGTLARMVASGKKYTIAINYTVHSVVNDANFFERPKGGGINRLFAFETGLGNHTSFASFTPDAIGGNYQYAPAWMYLSQGWNVTLHWAALYEGSYTAETLPEYQPKGYGAELAECQRYFQRINAKQREWRFHDAVIRNKVAIALLSIPIAPMRAIPSCYFMPGETITMVACPGGEALDGILGAVIDSVNEIDYTEDDHTITIQLSVTNTGNPGDRGCCFIGSSGSGYIDLSADL